MNSYKNSFAKKLFKSVIMLLIIISIDSVLYAQPSPINVLPTMPSPTVANLAKFCDFPEIDQTGAVPIGIQIWDLSYKGIKIPISLSYQSSGIRVGQESSWVGLGWNLNSLCFIARSVKDEPDDVSGWLKHPERYKNFPDLAGIEGNNIYNKSADFLRYNTAYSRYDSEPDIFYLTIGSIKEKFTFDHSGNIVFINPKQKFTVTKTVENDANGISEFCVTDIMGNKYFFGSTISPDFSEVTTISINTAGYSYLEYTGETLNYHFNEGQIVKYKFKTVWFLRKVQPVNTQSSIDFLYEPSSESFDVMLDVYHTGTSNPTDEHIPIMQGLWSGLKKITHSASTKYLKQIITPISSIVFTLGAREDIKGSKRLDNLIIKNSNNQIIQKCDFKYSYHVAPGTEDIYERTRLYLDKVIVSDNQPYELNYSPLELPSKKSFKQDLWGYYSSKSTSFIPQIWVYPSRTDYLLYSCFPIIGDNNTILLQGSDRSVDENSILAGSLVSIKLPTGGYHKFDFEPNDFYDENWGVKKGGGLRIRKLEYLDKDLNVLLKRNYTYTNGSNSSGVLINGLFFATPVGYSFTAPTEDFLYKEITNSWAHFTLRKGNNYFPLSSNDGTLVSYTKVTINEEGNGRIENAYYPPQDYKTNPTKVYCSSVYFFTSVDGPRGLNLYDMRSTTYVDLKTYGLSDKSNTISVPVYENVDAWNWGPFGVNDIYYYFKYNNNYYKLDYYFRYRELYVTMMTSMGKIQTSGYNIFPFPQKSDDGDFSKGSIKEKRIYKEGSNLPIKQINYFYTSNGIPIEIYGLNYKTAYTCFNSLSPLPLEKNWEIDYGKNGQLFIMNNLSHWVLPKLWGKYKLITNASVYLSGKTETEYFDNGTFRTTNYSYEYDDDNLMKAEQTEVAGQVNRTEYRYLKDVYTAQGHPSDEICKGFKIMQENGMYGNPLEIIKLKNNNVISSVFQVFKEFPANSNKAFPFINYSMESKQPVSSSSYVRATVSSGASVIKDLSLQPKTTYDSYDDLGNLLQYHKTGDIPSSYIWGYNKTQPIAEVKNAKTDEIFFTSYEEDSDFSGLSYKCTTSSHSGHNCHIVPAGGFNKAIDFAKSNLNGKYVYSGWIKTEGNGTFISIKDFTNGVTNAYSSTPVPNTYGEWKYYEAVVDIDAPEYANSNNIRVEVWNSGSTTSYVDDVRFKPVAAQMTTYTYDPLIGMTSATDANNHATFYEYDGLGRLQYSKDEDKNIISYNKYHYVNEKSDWTVSVQPLGDNSYTFSVVGNFDCSDYRYVWTIGGQEIPTASCTVSHQFSTLLTGMVTVTVKIYAGDELIDTLTSTCICIGSNALQLTMTGVNNSGFKFTVNGVATSWGLTYEWDFGDGNTQTTNNPSYTYYYSEIGHYTATVKVKQGDKLLKILSIIVNVDDTELTPY